MISSVGNYAGKALLVVAAPILGLLRHSLAGRSACGKLFFLVESTSCGEHFLRRVFLAKSTFGGELF
jgi:hypothetical protein